jgi:putative thioredoxin
MQAHLKLEIMSDKMCPMPIVKSQAILNTDARPRPSHNLQCRRTFSYGNGLMTNSPYVFDASADNFPRLVLENSTKGPVLVNYWSPHAGPCLMLMPRLVRLAGEFGGRFLLVMLNTDELGPLARGHGVVSLPTIKVYRHGQVVNTLHGAESENVLRDFIRKQLTDTTDTLLLNALSTHAQGDTASAVRLAAEAALADPQNTRIPLDLAKLLVLQGRYAQADDLLQALPAEARDDQELRQLAAHVSVLRAAREAPPVAELEQAIAVNPDNLEARYQLSAVQLVANDYDAAMPQLLEIARRDRGFRHDAGRNGLLALFELLGDDDERVVRYRALLQATMH